MRLSRGLLPAIFCSSFTLLIVSALIGQQLPEPPPVVRSLVSEVLVPVVVRDAHGHVVGYLKKDDFQVFDDGKPQTITSFTIIKRATETSAANSSASRPDATGSPAASQPTSPSQRSIFFLFDNYNLTFDDLVHAQQAAIKMLDSSLAPADMAAVLASSGTSSGLTRDHAKLKQKILDLRVKTLLRPDERECPNIDYYQGDLIINKNDRQAFEAALVNVMHCSRGREGTGLTEDQAESLARSAAQRAVLLGERNYRSNLYFLQFILNGMATLPGQHVIILISSGFFIPDSEAVPIKSEILDSAARTNTVINALDARGMYTTNQGAETTVRMDQDSEQDTQRLVDRYRRQAMAANADVMGELADGTGGTFYHNSNDLETGFKTLISGPDYTYLLAFSIPSTKPASAHHSLKVKVNGPGLTVQARRGYSTPAPEQQRK